jgi:hypothetical protein
MSEDLAKLRRRRLAGDYPVAFFVRATEEEAAKIRENAATARRPLSRFLAEAGTRTDGKALPDVDEMREERAREMDVLEGLMFQLRKVGINLNQLAHRENSADLGSAALPPTDAEIQQATQAIEEVVNLIRDRLV